MPRFFFPHIIYLVFLARLSYVGVCLLGSFLLALSRARVLCFSLCAARFMLLLVFRFVDVSLFSIFLLFGARNVPGHDVQ